jgi:aminopeptidase N
MLTTMIRNTCGLLVFSFFFINLTMSQTKNKDLKLNVISYRVNVEPRVEEKFIQGDVTIDFLLEPTIHEVIFNSGNLQVTEIISQSVVHYVQKDNKLIISLADRVTNKNQLQIFYNGTPTRGFVLPEPGQAHTVFFTSEWMVCNDSPNDKAKFEINLLVPSDKTCIASGTLVKKLLKGEKVLFSWSQDYETSTYTYGFAIGSFNDFHGDYRGISLNYYSKNHTSAQLKTIFSHTSDMIAFFEERSGTPYIQNSYRQSLSGNVWFCPTKGIVR